jgi:hypothetical protein
MVFPVSIGGSIRLRRLPATEDAVERVISRIETLLDDASASSVVTEGSCVAFTAGLFGRGMWNWNILLPFGSGRLWVERRKASLTVKYRFSTVQMLLIVTAMMALVVLLAFPAQPDPGKALAKTLNFAAIGWLWLFGANYLVAMARVPIWLRLGLQKIPDHPDLRRRAD